MTYKIDELLLIENLTYLDDIPPMSKVIHHNGETVKQLLETIDYDLIDDEKYYASFMPGIDWKYMINAIKLNKRIMDAKIIDSHLDQAFGGGLGLSAIFVNEEMKEAVVAYRGTAAAEWTDDFLGANQIDSLQQINALEWYKAVYEKHNLKNYYVTVIGHSKGGNKAKYITILNNTVNRCVSFDGQGFSDKFMDYYKKEIVERQDVIENHNIDFDYVNILMNDIGKKTFYCGFNYGAGGFAESHSPNTFFDFIDDHTYRMEVNPNGQRPEMQILNQFINSMIRSADNDKERSKNNRLVGDLVEKAFSIGEEISTPDFISYLCDQLGHEDYVDNAAYLLSFAIKYSKQNPNFLNALKGIMTYFKANALVDTLNMLDDLLNSKKLGMLLGLSNFLIVHVNKIVVKKIQSIAKKKYDVELTAEQVSRVLNIISLVKERLNTLEVNFDGSGIRLTEESLINKNDNLIENLNIVVLAGGLSIERNMSLHSAYLISNELRAKGHKVILLDSYMGYSDEELDIKDAFDNPEKYSLTVDNITDELPDLWAVKKRRMYRSNSYFGPNVLNICHQSDLVFIALHGLDGENGNIQSTFDLLGIDYTGNDYNSSFKANNKSIAKDLMARSQIPLSRGYSLVKNEEIKFPEEYNMSYPVIVKPNSFGIGVGVSAVMDDEAFKKATLDAFKWDDEIIIEEFICGREFAVSTLDGKVLPVLEVLPLNPKSSLDLSSVKSKRCPANIDDELKNKLQEYALKATQILGLKAYSKIDFIVDKDNNIYLIECESSPSLSPYAHFSAEAYEDGYDYSSLCEKIIEMSINK